MRHSLMHDLRNLSSHRSAALRLTVAVALSGITGGGCGAPASGEDPADDSPAGLSAQSFELAAGTWAQLGTTLGPPATEPTSRPALTFDQRSRPVVAFSVHDGSADTDSTSVFGWRSDRWTALGARLAGGAPSITTDSQDRIAVCLGTARPAGPFAARWNGTAWAALGGDLGVETGYAVGRYTWPSCGGIVVDAGDTPVLAWSAHIGSKADAVYTARWNRRQQKWRGLDPQIDARATLAPLAIDDQDRVYVAGFTPGGSYGGGATTRVWRSAGAGWQQLGADMPNTAGPVIAVRGNAAPCLALSAAGAATISVKRWRAGAWQDLPGPGAGTNLALDFTPAGRPVIAYVDPSATGLIHVKQFAAGAWQDLGPGITAVTDQPLAIDLAVDPRGRATLAFTRGDSATGFTVSVARFSLALP